MGLGLDVSQDSGPRCMLASPRRYSPNSEAKALGRVYKDLCARGKDPTKPKNARTGPASSNYRLRRES